MCVQWVSCFGQCMIFFVMQDNAECWASLWSPTRPKELWKDPVRLNICKWFQNHFASWCELRPRDVSFMSCHFVLRYFKCRVYLGRNNVHVWALLLAQALLQTFAGAVSSAHAHTACSLPLAAWPVTAVKSLNRTGAWYKPAAVIKQAHFPFPWREKWVDEQRSKKQEKAPRRGDESGQRVTNAGFLQPTNQQQQGRLKATGMKKFSMCFSFGLLCQKHLWSTSTTHMYTQIYAYKQSGSCLCD